MRYADPARCPDCREPIPTPTPTHCPTCGMALSGHEVARLFQTLQSADLQLAAIRSKLAGSTSPAGPPAYASASPAPARAPRLTGVSVPQILLGLGALCVLVAALTFLVLAWSWLGVGGRTAILVGLTLAAGCAAIALTRRGLRIGGEAFAAIASGLVALDVAGAGDAGWFGTLSGAGTATACGLAVAVAAGLLVAATRPRSLVVPQVVAPVALTAASLAARAAWSWTSVGTLLFVAGLLGLAFLARRVGLPVLLIASLCAAGVPWLMLVADGFGTRLDVRTLWLHGQVWPLLAAAALLVAVSLLLPRLVRPLALAGAAVLATLAVVLPAVDESGTVLASVLLIAACLWAGLSLASPSTWRIVSAVPAALALLIPAFLAVVTAMMIVTPTLRAGRFTRSMTAHLPVATELPMTAPLLPAVALGLSLVLVAATSLLVDRRRAVWWVWPTAVALVVTGTVLAIAATGVPRIALALPLALTAAGLAVVPGGARGLIPAAPLALLALATAPPSTGLTALVLACFVTASATVLLRDGDSLVAQAALPLTLGGLVWTTGHLLDLAMVWRALPVVLIVAALAWWRPRPVLEASAATAAGAAVLASMSQGDLSDLAVHLTLAGACVVVHALLHRDRRLLAPVGGLLLAAATWCRLADLGVRQPEAYTLPTALALIAVGLWHLRRNPAASTLVALGPGLLLATVPSLLWALDEPLTLRAAWLGIACLLLVVGGALRRWSAPLLVGAVVGAVLVLRQIQPFAADLPPWLLIGVAGATLITVGLTWESRMRDLRRGASYVVALR